MVSKLVVAAILCLSSHVANVNASIDFPWEQKQHLLMRRVKKRANLAQLDAATATREQTQTGKPSATPFVTDASHVSDALFWGGHSPQGTGATPPFSTCPRDAVEHGRRGKKGKTGWTGSQEQQDIVYKAAASIHLAKAGTKLKIACAFKTATSERQLLLDSVQTWAKKCDVIYSFSNQTWQVPGPWNVNTIQLPSSGRDPKDSDSYGNLWHKTQAMMNTLHPLWQQEGFDFLVISDTDSFFVMENLRQYLSTSSIQQRQSAGKPILLGDLWQSDNKGVHAWVAGGGYVINQKVIEAVMSCPQHLRDQVTSAEDVMVSKCLIQGPFHYDVYDDGPACDADRNDRFEFQSILESRKTAVSSSMIMFHHIVGEQRYLFYQALYKDQTQRLCADEKAADGMVLLREEEEEELIEESSMKKGKINVACG